MESQIRLIVGAKEGRSYIRSLYVSPPFRVVSVGQLMHDNASHLMIMSTSPGVLSGDRYEIEVTVESGARLQLKSQSYQRIYDMDGRAHQTMHIKVCDGAHFSQVAHPIVPHRNSAFYAESQVELGRNSSFLQSEIITCGRRLHGEEFEFREFSNSVEVRSEGVLRLKDRVLLSPKRMPLSNIGLLEGYTHQGTLIYQTTCEGESVGDDVEAIYEMLRSSVGGRMKFGISESHYAGFIVRLLGRGGEELFEAMQAIQNYMWNKKIEKK